MNSQWTKQPSIPSPSLTPDYLYYGQFERTDEIDQRIYERNLSDVRLPPSFDPRPRETRHDTLQGMGANKVSSSRRPPLFQKYEPMTHFAPIQSDGPSQTFFENINVESHLRNQFFALQKGAIQSTYIPSSISDLYKIEAPTSFYRKEEPQPHPNLFERPTYETTCPPIFHKIGKSLVFNNPTQLELRSL